MKNIRFLYTAVFLLLLTFACSKTPQDVRTTSKIDPTLATITEIQDLFASEELTSAHLVRMCFDRIAEYDKKGPAINALITLNPHALDIAEALDKERIEKGPRSPLHGIPVILKDNYDTGDLPTTGGSAILAHSQPSDDAFVVNKLREAGAVIIGKANMSEFALSYGWLGYGSLVGQTRNPHNPLRDPSGSSSGSAAAIAAGYATLGTGTDTAGSIRGPAAVCGVVGIKPTMGLVSRDGIIPASLSFDVPGPIARSVTGAAIMLDIMAGPDPNDPATQAIQGRTFRFQTALNADALREARIGVIRTFLGANADVDSVFAASLKFLKKEGAEIIEIDLPEPLDSLWPVMGPVVDGDFGHQIEAYLASLPEGAPRTVADMIALAESEVIAESATPLNPARIQGFRDAEASGGYQSAERRRGLEELIPAIRKTLLSILDEQKLDALVFPTLPCPASPRHDAEDDTYTCNIDDPYRPCYMASTSGFPEITVPAGFTADKMPVGLSFLGRPFSEERLIGFAFDFEQATSARRVPAYTPKLGEDENE